MLRDVLLEAGDTTQAVRRDDRRSRRLLRRGARRRRRRAHAPRRARARAGRTQRAREMLRELGYELVDEPGAGAGVRGERSAGWSPRRYRRAARSYDPEAPLPSYDLEEIGPEDVSPAVLRSPSARAPRPIAAPPRAPAQRGRSTTSTIRSATATAAELPARGAPESAAAFDLVAHAAEDDATTLGDLRKPARPRRPAQLPERCPVAGPPELE